MSGNVRMPAHSWRMYKSIEVPLRILASKINATLYGYVIATSLYSCDSHRHSASHHYKCVAASTYHVVKMLPAENVSFQSYRHTSIFAARTNWVCGSNLSWLYCPPMMPTLTTPLYYPYYNLELTHITICLIDIARRPRVPWTPGNQSRYNAWQWYEMMMFWCHGTESCQLQARCTVSSAGGYWLRMVASTHTIYAMRSRLVKNES